MFATILGRLNAQDDSDVEWRKTSRERLDEILAQVKYTNGRVSSLEKWRTESKAKIAVLIGVASVAATAAGWIIQHLIFSN